MKNKSIYLALFINFSNISSQPTFTEHVIFNSAPIPYEPALRYVHAADIDGDGDMDVLSAFPYTDENMIVWYENDGDMDVISSTNNAIYYLENDGNPVEIIIPFS